MNPHHLADGLAMLFPDEPTAVARLPMRARLVARADRRAVQAYRHERELARLAYVRPDPELEAAVEVRRSERGRSGPVRGRAVSPWVLREVGGREEWVRWRQNALSTGPVWMTTKYHPAARVAVRWGHWEATTSDHHGGMEWTTVDGVEAGKALCDDRLRAAGHTFWEAP